MQDTAAAATYICLRLYCVYLEVLIDISEKEENGHFQSGKIHFGDDIKIHTQLMQLVCFVKSPIMKLIDGCSCSQCGTEVR